MTPILVVGLGRCGSSLVMQMLHAAGVECHGRYPAFEPEDVNIGRVPRELLSRGAAMKILGPHRDIDYWPTRIDARVIWLDRSPTEQAKSQVKFLRLMAGMDVPGQAWRAVRKGLLADREKCLEWMDRCEPTPLVLSFEGIIRQPLVAAAAIASFLDLPLTVENRMAGAVLPRGTMCESGIDIEFRLCEEAGR